MELPDRVQKLEKEFRDHRHNGRDSVRIDFSLEKQDALTAKDDATVTATYTSTEANVINNNRTRIEEIEDALKAVGILS